MAKRKTAPSPAAQAAGGMSPLADSQPPGWAREPFGAAAAPTLRGTFLAHYSSRGLARLEFPGRWSAARFKAKGRLPRTMARWHRLTCQAVRRVLQGRSPRSLPPLDLAAGTAFQRRVWRALLAIPLGQTLAYGQLACKIGQPLTARAVGQACGANPIPLLIPCHRAVAADGRLGGFSAGLPWKQWLLAREGVRLGAQARSRAATNRAARRPEPGQAC